VEMSHDCSEHGGGGVGGIFQTLEELDFDRGPWTIASNGDYPSIMKYLNKGGEPNLRDSAGYTALHYSARNGHENISRALVDHGAHVNAQTKAGLSTPLHRAALNGCHLVVKLLLDNNADVCMQDSDGKTALHKAVEGNWPEVCKLLIAHEPKCTEISDKNLKLPRNLTHDDVDHSEVYKLLNWR
uniref:Uncharacterized protein n=2 Tax=Ciona intestinalis TaxID=7719 RepID=F7B236_CIOIN